MSKMLYGSIDLTKIDKSKINNHENGSKYYPIVVWINDEPDKYGNIASIQQGQTKEERDAKEAKTYIGNLREPQSDQSSPIGTPKKADGIIGDGDLPF